MSIQDDVKQILDQKEPPPLPKEENSFNPNSIKNNSDFSYKNPFEEKKEEYKPNPLLKTLRSFHGDLEETINKNKESVVSIAVAEQKVKTEEKKKEEKAVISGAPITKTQVVFEDSFFTKFKSSISLVLALVLFISAIGVLTTLYILKADKKTTVPLKTEKSILPFTSKKEIETYSKNKEKIFSDLVSFKNSFKDSLNSILYLKLLYTTDKNENILDAENFMNMLSTQAPQSLKRTFSGTNYMVGVFSFDTNEFFMLLKPSDYGNAYSGMLKWEPIMANDLSIFFPNSQNSTGVFKDDVYKSKDVRVLRDNQGKVVLIYGFIDRETILITANEKIFEALVLKYINSQIVR